jgi:hypothetical protein
MLIDAHEIVLNEESGIDEVKERIVGKVKRTQVVLKGGRDAVEFDLGDKKSVRIQGTSAELFTLCKKIIDEIYKDQPMQKAIAKANLIGE